MVVFLGEKPSGNPDRGFLGSLHRRFPHTPSRGKLLVAWKLFKQRANFIFPAIFRTDPEDWMKVRVGTGRLAGLPATDELSRTSPLTREILS